MGCINCRGYLECRRLFLLPKWATQPKTTVARVSSSHDKDWQSVLCIQQVTGVVFLQASVRLMVFSAEDGGITQAGCKHASCQGDSQSNYRIIQCKLLGDNNNKSGLTHRFENLGLTNLPVICYSSKSVKQYNMSQAWQLDSKEIDLLFPFTLNCENPEMEKNINASG